MQRGQTRWNLRQGLRRQPLRFGCQACRSTEEAEARSHRKAQALADKGRAKAESPLSRPKNVTQTKEGIKG